MLSSMPPVTLLEGSSLCRDVPPIASEVACQQHVGRLGVVVPTNSMAYGSLHFWRLQVTS